MALESNLMMIHILKERIKQVEKRIRQRIQLKPEFKKLLTVSGIGTILALTVWKLHCGIGYLCGLSASLPYVFLIIKTILPLNFECEIENLLLGSVRQKHGIDDTVDIAVLRLPVQ